MQCLKMLDYKEFQCGVLICNLLFIKSAWANLSLIAIRHLNRASLSAELCPIWVLPSYPKQKYYWWILAFWRPVGFWKMLISAFLHHRKIKSLFLQADFISGKSYQLFAFLKTSFSINWIFPVKKHLLTAHTDRCSCAPFSVLRPEH